VFDIDGVIADYETCYEKFLIEEKGLEPIDNFRRATYSFYKRFGITRLKEEQCHQDFIYWGGFRKLQICPGVIELIRYARALRFKIVLVTARPVWVHKRIYEDTHIWLKESEIDYDLLLFNKDKADAVINGIYPAKIVCFIEDRDKHAIELSHIGVPVVLINKSYNESIDIQHVVRVDDLYDVIELLVDMEEKR
jgi:uncharacterized HAD superfamily protein